MECASDGREIARLKNSDICSIVQNYVLLDSLDVRQGESVGRTSGDRNATPVGSARLGSGTGNGTGEAFRATYCGL